MKYKGKAVVEKNSTIVSINKGKEVYEFIVSPLPMGWWQKMRAIGLSIYPEPKRIPLVDKKGVVVRNKATGKAEVIDDESDPEYKKQLALFSQRLRVIQLVTHLRDDPNIEWDTQEPQTEKLEEWQEYADKLIKELMGTSLTEEEVAQIINEGEELACVHSLESVADENFLTPT